MKILVVEDDPTIAHTLQLLLSTYNYAVDIAADGETGWQMAEAYKYDLILLDVILPGLDGISLCQQLRKAGYKTPILLLTGQTGGHQKAIALNAGADDYVVKPFNTEELIARVQALLRRGQASSQPILTWGQLSIDPSTRKVIYGNDSLSTTPKEYAILELLLRNPQKALSSRVMIDQVWSSLEFPGEEAVRAHIKELRRKLTRVGAPKDLIKTVHRVGYQLNPQYSNVLAVQVQQQPTTPQTAELTLVNQELRLTLEELQVADAELRQQNEQLELAQQTLELEHLRYQDLFEFAPDAYLVTNIHGVIQEANRAASDLFHVNPQHLLGKPLVVFIASCDRPDFRLQLTQLNFAQNWEIYVKPRNDKPFPVLIAVTTIKNLQNEVVGLRWLLRDIRPRKELEQQLQAARDELERQVVERTVELQILYDQDSYGYHSLDAEGRIIQINEIELTMLGYSREEVTGRKITDFYTPEGLQLFQENYPRFMQQGWVADLEFTVVRKDGTLLPVSISSTAIRDEAGNFLMSRSVVVNISERWRAENERKQAEARLRESEQKYRSLFESLDQGFCLLEVLFDANDKPIDYRFIEINQAFEQQSGLVNAVGKTILELVPNLEPQWAKLYGQVAKSGEAIRFEADVPSMNRVFDIYAFPSGAPGQNLVAVLFADITERKRAEEILRQTAEFDAFRVSLADALRPLTDASEIQAIAARILGKSLRATRVIYIEVVSEGEAVIVHHNYTNGVAELSGQYRLEDYRRNLIADHQAGQTQIVTDIPDNPKYTDAEKARYRELDIAAHIDVPLIKNNQFVALLAVHQSTPRQWTETEVKLVEETAERTWAALERARAEAALHQNEEMLRLALAGAHAGTWDWDLATRHLTWSPETYQLCGLDPTAGLPQDEGWYDNLLHPDDRDRVSAYVSQVLNQKIPEFQLEFRIVHPQHGVRWLLSRGCLTCNAAGEPVRLSGINLDISDRKLVEQKIREQAALLDITSDAIFVQDLDHRILYWNQGATQLYGWLETEAIGQIAHQLLHANPNRNSEIMQTLLTQGEWRGELHKTTKTGKVVIVEAQWTLRRDEAHQPQFILSVDTDITEKKQLEAQFYRAQRLESLGTLASGIAHDLNNVLTPILAIAQLFRLQQPSLNSQSQEMLQILEDSTKRGTNLIKQILTFARGTGGERHPIQVISLVQEVFNIVQQSFPKTITIRQSIPDPCPWFVAADSTYLHQVLMNLCVNARDAMPNRGVLSLSVEHYYVDQAFAQSNLDAQVGDYVAITIADTGRGIPPEVRDRIFDPFFTTKPPGQGTGLGLATVLGIVKEYGGFLQVLSEVDRGTQMKVFLPILEGTLSPSPPLEQPCDGNGELVLIVDDDVAVQYSIQSLLENYHYSVLSTHDGMEAIALYTQHQSDVRLVILDIMMPTMSGITLIQKLKEINPTVKIMAMSGLPVNREPALAKGANAFLSKPYTLENLLENLQALIVDS